MKISSVEEASKAAEIAAEKQKSIDEFSKRFLV